MKRSLTTLIILITCVMLTSCNNMTNQDVGTLGGGVAGGLLGSTIGGGSGRMLAITAGTLAGAIIGGSMGRDMDANDHARMNRALDSNPVGEPTYWRNANTGATYQVVPTRNVEVENNRYCREYRTVAQIAGKKQQVYGTACRQPDGSWQAINPGE